MWFWLSRLTQNIFTVAKLRLTHPELREAIISLFKATLHYPKTYDLKVVWMVP